MCKHLSAGAARAVVEAGACQKSQITKRRDVHELDGVSTQMEAKRPQALGSSRGQTDPQTWREAPDKAQLPQQRMLASIFSEILSLEEDLTAHTTSALPSPL